MKVPRAPVVDGDDLSRDWRKALEAEARMAGLSDVPRGAPPAALDLEWSLWWERLGGNVLPRAPLYDDAGQVTRPWRLWLEAI